jgi:hypothetical protein
VSAARVRRHPDDGGDHVVTFEPSVEVRSIGVTEATVDFASSELPFLGSRSLVLGHRLQVGPDGQLSGTASGQGDGDQIHCRYDVALTGTRID